MKRAVSPCWKHCQHGSHLRNNQPTVRRSNDTIRKLLIRAIIVWIVVSVSLFWKKIINNKVKMGKFAINNANDLYTTTSLPFSNPRAPFGSAYFALQSVLISLFWEKIFNNKQKWANSLSTMRMPSTQQPANRSEIRGYHSEALIMHYNRVNCRFDILILKENNQQ